MVYSDNIYENTGYILRNLNKSATQAKGTWVSGTGYGFYGTSLEKPLTMNHLYYQRYYYKFSTTNQSPTWVNYYLYGGMQGGSGKSGGLTADTEYLISGIVTPNMGAGNSPRSMTIYNGDSSAISGVTSYVKDVIVYDVTDLYNILRAKGVISNSHDSLKTWCDSNLLYVTTGTDYDISEYTISVPNEYQQLDYLQVSASQYINTGIIFDGNAAPIRINFTVTPDDSSGKNYCLAGCGDSVWNGPVMLNYCGNRMEFGCSGYTAAGSYNPGQKYFYNINFDRSIQTGYQDGIQFLNATKTYAGSTGSLYLFCFGVASSPSNTYFSGKLHHMAVYDNTGLRGQFIPAKRKSDLVLGMYDTVSNTFLTGSGDFTAGSVVSSLKPEVKFSNGGLSDCKIVEPDAMRKYSASSSLANDPWFDTSIPVSVYNNSGGGTVTHTRIAASTQNSPFTGDHPYILKITTDGTASPYAGGFVAYHTSAANKVFIEKFVAKVPVGYEVTDHQNSQGSGASIQWITPTAGTGDWEEYAVLYRCGSSGSFSTGGHIALNGSNNTSVTWYVAYVNNCDITDNEDLMNYKILPSQTSIKDGKIFSGEFNVTNLMTNGDCHVQDAASLPNGWQYDTTDYAGNSTCSLVQPVGAGSGIFGPLLPIDPMNRYKVSFWVKCKQDMSSFLTAICYYTSDGRGPWTHQEVNYYSGTKTTLSAALNNGDTQITVASNSNWASRSYSRLGFRSSIYNVSYNNVGTSHGYSGSTGLIKGTSGSNIVTLNTSYSGSTIPAGTCVVESYDGGTYPYPINKGNLPTDNTWKYVEGYFGSQEVLWDGAGSWDAIPADMRYIRLYLNIYNNDGSVPIKYSDMRITPVTADNGRLEKKVSITC